MQWKPEKYGGIQTIRVPPNQVWTPDVKTDEYCFVDIYLKQKKIKYLGCFI